MAHEQTEAPQDIETLKDRYQALDKRKTTAEANLQHAQKQLDDLKKKAKKEYGTDDIDELREKLQQMQQENREKRRRYQESLDEIETRLSEIEQEYEGAEEQNGEAGGGEEE